jgi:hypothetical protein
MNQYRQQCPSGSEHAGLVWRSKPAGTQEETQIPLKTAEDAIPATSEWMRISFTTFLSSEANALLGIRDVGELKFYCMERFKGILSLTVKGSLSTNSPTPDWASERIKTAWNVERSVRIVSNLPFAFGFSCGRA